MQDANKLIQGELNSSTSDQRRLGHRIQRRSDFHIPSYFTLCPEDRQRFSPGLVLCGTDALLSATQIPAEQGLQCPVLAPLPSSSGQCNQKRIMFYTCTWWYSMHLENNGMNIWKFCHGSFEDQKYFCPMAHSSVPI